MLSAARAAAHQRPSFKPLSSRAQATRASGRKSLYFDPGKIVDFVGIEREEGDALIAKLKECMIAPDAEYHHKWEKGDIVIWDNRCSYHRAAGDYPPEEDRIHWRVSINDFGVEVAEAAE
jgi:taurine dioxygenase